jgi:hypothetical protein
MMAMAASMVEFGPTVRMSVVITSRTFMAVAPLFVACGVTARTMDRSGRHDLDPGQILVERHSIRGRPTLATGRQGLACHRRLTSAGRLVLRWRRGLTVGCGLLGRLPAREPFLLS